VIPFLTFPPEVRRVIYTTNAIEAITATAQSDQDKGHFPNEEAARKLIYLAVNNAVPAWTRTRNWTTALLAFISTSETAYPTEPPTQKVGHPPALF
jgi:putative transposase